jgi:hypothetical protein
LNLAPGESTDSGHAAAAEQRNELAPFHLAGLHSVPASQGRITRYGIGGEQSAGIGQPSALAPNVEMGEYFKVGQIQAGTVRGPLSTFCSPRGINTASMIATRMSAGTSPTK